jgi:hypothetical protein
MEQVISAELEQIKSLVEALIGNPNEQGVLDGLQEYLNGRKQDIEATSRA